MPRKSVFDLSVLIPATMVAALVADLVLRCVPPERFAPRPWEAMTLNVTADRGLDVFTPNKSVEMETVGDLALMGNLPAYGRSRVEVFSADRFGLRNAPEVWRDSPSTMIVGDSFVAGAGVNDDETLSAQLSKLTGEAIYNAGYMNHDPASIQRLAKLLKLTDGTVICEVLDRGEDPGHLYDGEPAEFVTRLRPWLGQKFSGMVEAVWAFGRKSRLKIISQRLMRKVQDDRWLPNPYAEKVLAAQLTNGETMLFLQVDVDTVTLRRDAMRDVKRLVHLRDELQRAGLKMTTLLVPNKYTLYRPMLIDANLPSVDDDDYLDDLERGLNQANIPTLNLTMLLKQKAAADFAAGEYLFLLDDTHWNARGIAFSAEEIARHWSLR